MAKNPKHKKIQENQTFSLGWPRSLEEHRILTKKIEDASSTGSAHRTGWHIVGQVGPPLTHRRTVRPTVLVDALSNGSAHRTGWRIVERFGPPYWLTHRRTVRPTVLVDASSNGLPCKNPWILYIHKQIRQSRQFPWHLLLYCTREKLTCLMTSPVSSSTLMRAKGL